jgi:hypothetical protein
VEDKVSDVTIDPVHVVRVANGSGYARQGRHYAWVEMTEEQAATWTGNAWRIRT